MDQESPPQKKKKKTNNAKQMTTYLVNALVWKTDFDSNDIIG